MQPPPSSPVPAPLTPGVGRDPCALDGTVRYQVVLPGSRIAVTVLVSGAAAAQAHRIEPHLWAVYDALADGMPTGPHLLR